MTDSIFNYDKTDYERPQLFFGQKPGLHDTIHKAYPAIWELYKTQCSLNWSEDEFNYSSCNADFKSASKSVYDMMIKTLAWQFEADSVASRSIAPVLAPFITSSELWAAWLKISEIEVIHGSGYSEIIRNSFDDPSVVFDELLAVEEAHSRLSRVVEVFAEGYDLSHRYALGLADASQENYNTLIKMIVALYCMERIQFMASFAVTFAICDTGMFQPIGKCIQKIAQDELEVHAELDRVVLELEFRTERGRTALDQISDDLRLLVEEVIDSELEWVDYLFSEGRELVGMTPDRLKSWTLYCAKDVYATLGVESKYDLPEVNPLRFMEKWLNISKTQASPQEQDIAAYKVGILRRTDSDTVFDADF